MMFSSTNQKLYLHYSVCVFLLALLVIVSQNAAAQIAFVKNEKANPLQHFAVSSLRQSIPLFTDIDNDGDQDCFSGEFNYSKSGVVSSHIAFYKNNGDAKHPLFAEVKKSDNPLSQIAITGLVLPAFADIDGDGDADCFVASNNGSVIFYKNTGTADKAVFTKQSAAFNPLSGTKFSGVEISQFLLRDIDKDGDADCLITDKEGNGIYLVNAGSATQPRFMLSSTNNPFSIINNIPVNTVSLYDWNKDGKVDLFAGNALYQNNTGRFTKQAFSPASSDDDATAATWVDLNADGTPELVNGTTDGRFAYSTLSSTAAKPVAFVTVSPNPTSAYFTVSMSSSTGQKTLKVITLDGKTVLSQTIAGSTYTFGETLGKGIYLVQVLASGQTLAESRIVKM